jgi:cytochrome c oxidase assembly protein subunit 15
MDAPALYNLSPLWRLLLLGAAVALLPLCWVAWRNPAPARRLQALTLLTLFLSFDLVLFGAFTRLTDSGLGCPDWPGCYGMASPLGAATPISAAQSALPSGAVTHGKAWIEMLHRYLAGAVGLLIVALTLVHWRGQRSRVGDFHPVWAMATLVWVCVQGAFGALTVTMKLFPVIVSLHLLGGLVLLALLAAQVAHQALATEKLSLAAPLGAAVGGVLLLTVLQSALGAWVSTNYAVLACNSFPLCQGSWWPTMDFAQGFSLWRELGMTAQGQVLDFAALTAIHYVHRLFAVLALAALLGLAWHLGRVPAWRRQAWLLAGLSLLQLGTGLSNVLLDWPLLGAVLHTGGAAALVVVLVGIHCGAPRSGA